MHWTTIMGDEQNNSYFLGVEILLLGLINMSFNAPNLDESFVRSSLINSLVHGLGCAH